MAQITYSYQSAGEDEEAKKQLE